MDYSTPQCIHRRESITNTNNSTNIRYNSKSFLDAPIGTRGSCLMKKAGEERSRGTVPLSVGIHHVRNFPHFCIEGIAALFIRQVHERNSSSRKRNKLVLIPTEKRDGIKKT
jgi:hypothetical protein